MLRSILCVVSAQIYWMIVIWQRTGVFWHVLTIICLLYAAAWFIKACLRGGYSVNE
jgi:hypothetical protein